VWSFKAIYDETKIVDPNLIGWWKFEDDATDSSGYGRDGTEVNVPAYVDGYDNKAISLDGVDDYVYITDSSPFNLNTGITVACWIKVDQFDKTWQAIVTKGDNAWRIHRSGTTNFINWACDALTPRDITGTTNVNDGAWHHIAGVHNGVGLYLYVDGTVEAAVATTGTINSTNYLVNIGENAQQTGRYWLGDIDDVQIYNYGLSQAEIAATMRGDPSRAWNPNPKHGATGVSRQPTLSWTPGDFAPATNGHYVSFGDDPASLSPLGPQPQTPNNISVGPFDLGKTYYWAVDEANAAAPDGKDLGRIWKFTTADYLELEDFETYDWDRQLGEDANWVYYVWTDGLANFLYLPDMGGNETGANIFTRTDTFLGGLQAMRFDYDNDGFAENPRTGAQLPRLHKWSKAKAEIANLPSGIESDWTAAGARALSLWFYGDSLNDIEPMWVELTDSSGRAETVIYGDYEGEEPNHITEASWHEWNIDLQDFGDGGVNLSDVNSIAIGFGIEGDLGGGGVGWVFFDDIRVYAPRCVLSRRSEEYAKLDYAPENTGGDCKIDYHEFDIMTRDWLMNDLLITATAPGDANLVAHYEFNGNFNDSSVNAIHGEPNGFVYTSYNADRASTVAVFGDTNDYVDCGMDPALDIANAITIALWMNHNSADATTNDRGLVGRGGGWDDPGYTFWMHASDDGRALRPELQGPADKQQLLSGMRPPKDEWHHVAFTWPTPGTTDLITLYVDGNPVATNAFTGPIGTPTYSLRIGDYSGDPLQNRYFYGMLDDVRLYSKALSHEEIVSTMGLSELYSPVGSPAEIYEEEAKGSRFVNFEDYALLLQSWLVDGSWP